jgi:hypothetical protein
LGRPPFVAARKSMCAQISDLVGRMIPPVTLFPIKPDPKDLPGRTFPPHILCFAQ